MDIMKPVKLTVVGDSYSEKTCVLHYYTTKNQCGEYKPTVFENYSELKILDGNYYHVKLWDTAGQEDYRHLRPLSYPHTTCFLIFFAIDNVRSLENALFTWMPEVRAHMPKTPCILVGTKGEKRLNLNDTDNLISLENIMQVIRSSKAADYVECSSTTGVGVEELIETAIRCSYSKKSPLYKRKITEITHFLNKMKDWIVLKVRERAIQISRPEQKKQTNIKNDYYLC